MRGRPSGEKTRCSGTWTEAKFKSFIKNNLRSATRKWKPIQDCKKKANVKRGFYLCAECKEVVPITVPHEGKRMKNIFVDHIEPVVDEKEGFVDWDTVIERMFAEEGNLQVLCASCHSKKSNAEVAVRKEYRGLHKKHPREYNSWKSARGRCGNINHHAWEKYGGRGIKFSPEWDDFNIFLSDMGERPEGTSLDRIDNDGDYCADNCQWANPVEQARNKSNNFLLEYEGRVQCVAAWGRELSIHSSTILNRISRGDSVGRALSTEYAKKKRPSNIPIDKLMEAYEEEPSYRALGLMFGLHKDTVRKAIARRAKEKLNEQ